MIASTIIPPQEAFKVVGLFYDLASGRINIVAPMQGSA